MWRHLYDDPYYQARARALYERGRQTVNTPTPAPLPSWYVNTINVLTDLWQRAGTKLIGYATMAVGVLAALDESSIQVVQGILGPKYGKYFPYACMICAGLVVRVRGSKNTSDIADHIINRANAGDPSASSAVAAATSNAVAASDKVLLVNKPPEIPK